MVTRFFGAFFVPVVSNAPMRARTLMESSDWPTLAKAVYRPSAQRASAGSVTKNRESTVSPSPRAMLTSPATVKRYAFDALAVQV